MEHVMILFEHLLRPGGLYVVEGLDTSTMERLQKEATNRILNSQQDTNISMTLEQNRLILRKN